MFYNDYSDGKYDGGDDAKTAINDSARDFQRAHATVCLYCLSFYPAEDSLYIIELFPYFPVAIRFFHTLVCYHQPNIWEKTAGMETGATYSSLIAIIESCI